MKSKPRVFIIESLRFEDERQDRYEGKFISQILYLSGSPSEYVYLRTKNELKRVLRDFKECHYRYLHFSCHGSKEAIALTLDGLAFDELGTLLTP